MQSDEKTGTQKRSVLAGEHHGCRDFQTCNYLKYS